MKKKVTMLAISTAMLAALALTGCSSPSYADALYDCKNDHVGNAPGDTALLSQLGVDALGSYTLELQTDAEPYGLTVVFAREPADAALLDQAMEKNGCVLLALIGNLGSVSWTYPEDGARATGTISREMAGEMAGEDIGSFGDSAKSVQTLLDKLDLTLPKE